MKVYIDFSVLVGDRSAYGRASGIIELPAIPAIGSQINFSIKMPRSFSVETVTFFPGEDVPVSLGLEDFVIESSEEALIYSKLLKNKFGIYIDKYD